MHIIHFFRGIPSGFLFGLFNLDLSEWRPGVNIHVISSHWARVLTTSCSMSIISQTDFLTSASTYTQCRTWHIVDRPVTQTYHDARDVQLSECSTYHMVYKEKSPAMYLRTFSFLNLCPEPWFCKNNTPPATSRTLFVAKQGH